MGGRRAGLVVVALALTFGVVAFVQAYRGAREQASHAERGEMRLAISNQAGMPVRLHGAGNTLDAARAVAVDPDGAWLASGRYFLEAGPPGAAAFYPLPFDRARADWTPGSSLPVAVRAFRPGPPPALDRAPPMVFVPAGYFEMGDRKNPGESHLVWVTSFHIGAFEVTNGEFRRFLTHPEGYDDRRNWTEAGWNWRLSGQSHVTARLEPADPLFPRFGRDDLPVVLATWFEANAYARWLTRQAGGGRWLFRLPTEAEWEKAARGPDGFDYGLGMTLSEPESPLYNWKKNPEAATTLVGVEATAAGYRPNRYGLYHASGNAAEWTQSISRPFNWKAPWRDDDRNDDRATGLRTTRGGSWYSATTSRLHLAYREEFQPELSSNDLGFRVVALALP